MSLWVRLTDTADRPYYWNPYTAATSWTAPHLEEVVWIAVRTQENRLYYWNKQTQMTSWDPPGTRSQSRPDHQSRLQTNTARNQSDGLGLATIPTNPRGRTQWCFTRFNIGGSPSRALEFDRVDRDRSLGRTAKSLEAANPQDATASQETALPPCETASAWVEVEGDSGQPYFWNFLRDVSVVSLPPGEVASFSACLTGDGGCFYRNDAGNSVWDLPGTRTDSREDCLRDAADEQQARWVEAGAGVMLSNLNDSRYNDQVGCVVRFWDRRVVVKLADCLGGIELAVCLKNVCPLREKTIVELRGLSQQNLNGQVGTVEKVDHEACRYQVLLRDKNIKVVRPTKALPKCRLWDINLTNCHSWLQWRQEQECLFIDGCGNHQKYFLHLPLGFGASVGNAQLKDAQQWPVLLYLHGTGGSSFFLHSKRTIRSNGLQYAAGKFVVVSPHCDWTWREAPRPWVIELMAALRAASWVDSRRIYLTGCSMGGMGTWEVAARSPEIFSAVAPVAAHHQQDRTEYIAKRLEATPTMVLHSLHDETCPSRLEEPLWNRLQDSNPDFELHLAENIDHCSMYERAYCDDTILFDWLLSHEAPS